MDTFVTVELPRQGVGLGLFSYWQTRGLAYLSVLLLPTASPWQAYRMGNSRFGSSPSRPPEQAQSILKLPNITPGVIQLSSWGPHHLFPQLKYRSRGCLIIFPQCHCFPLLSWPPGLGEGSWKKRATARARSNLALKFRFKTARSAPQNEQCQPSIPVYFSLD